VFGGRPNDQPGGGCSWSHRKRCSSHAQSTADNDRSPAAHGRDFPRSHQQRPNGDEGRIAKMWNTIAWILQGLLAFAFLFHGILFVFRPEPLVRPMREQGNWPLGIPAWFRIFIGVAELLAAVGLIVPGLFHLLTFLTPLAAAGLVIVMFSASVYHVRRGEGAALPAVGALLVVAAIVAIVRWQVAAL